MDRLAIRVTFDDEVDVLPPKRENESGRGAVVCLCCQKKRLARIWTPTAAVSARNALHHEDPRIRAFA